MGDVCGHIGRLHESIMLSASKLMLAMKQGVISERLLVLSTAVCTLLLLLIWPFVFVLGQSYRAALSGEIVENILHCIATRQDIA